jgi:hypothetical protein
MLAVISRAQRNQNTKQTKISRCNRAETDVYGAAFFFVFFVLKRKRRPKK